MCFWHFYLQLFYAYIFYFIHFYLYFIFIYLMYICVKWTDSIYCMYFMVLVFVTIITLTRTPLNKWNIQYSTVIEQCSIQLCETFITACCFIHFSRRQNTLHLAQHAYYFILNALPCSIFINFPKSPSLSLIRAFVIKHHYGWVRVVKGHAAVSLLLQRCCPCAGSLSREQPLKHRAHFTNQ